MICKSDDIIPVARVFLIGRLRVQLGTVSTFVTVWESGSADLLSENLSRSAKTIYVDITDSSIKNPRSELVKWNDDHQGGKQKQ